MLLNHPEARYAYGFVRLLSPDEKIRLDGAKALKTLEKESYLSLSDGRDMLKERLKFTWIKHNRFRPKRKFCSISHIGWEGDQPNLVEDDCPLCRGRKEVVWVCGSLADQKFMTNIVLF